MLKIAIIGAGFMGLTHAKAYAEVTNCQLAAICDTSESLRKDFSETYRCAAFANIDTLLNECDFDVIDICLPTFLHEETVVKAASAKKDIICEKPFSLSVASLDRMFNAVRENQVRLCVGQVLRFWQEYVDAHHFVRSGTLGSIRYAYAARLSDHPKWSDWYRRAENSGGGLFDLHLHDIDFMIWTFGRVKSVFAAGTKNEYGCWNHVNSTLIFEDGTSASVQGVLEMGAGYPFTMELRIVGTNKTYEYGMRAGDNLSNRDQALRATRIYENGNVTVADQKPRDAYTVELEHFVQCLNEGHESNVIPNAEVRDVLCTVEALRDSLESGKLVTVNYDRREK